MNFEFKDKYDINDLISLITLLRAPGGCPWDREQTHESIKSNFIEETYEVIEAINKNSISGLREELGDVLLQIALHCEMESEKGNFDFNDVCDELCKKLIVRHPHVFGDKVANNTKEALDSWDSVKASIKGTKTASSKMDSIPIELPALMRAQKVQSKAAKAGFDWDNQNGAFLKLNEEINELKIALSHNNQAEIEDEFGDVLFSCVNISRFIGVDSEEALKASTDKFITRFKIVEKLADENDIDMNNSSIDELDALWDKAKENRTEEKAIFIDECWQLIGASSNRLAAEFVLEIFKIIRGYGGSAVCATQDLNDFFALEDGKYGKGIINNSKTKVILNLEDEEAQRVGSILHLSEAELMEITHFERGSALISTNNNNVAVEIKCSELEKELITTDRRELQELLKRNGKIERV